MANKHCGLRLRIICFTEYDEDCNVDYGQFMTGLAFKHYCFSGKPCNFHQPFIIQKNAFDFRCDQQDASQNLHTLTMNFTKAL